MRSTWEDSVLKRGKSELFIPENLDIESNRFGTILAHSGSHISKFPGPRSRLFSPQDVVNLTYKSWALFVFDRHNSYVDPIPALHRHCNPL